MTISTNSNSVAPTETQIDLLSPIRDEEDNIRLKQIESDMLRLKEHVAYELIKIGKHLIEAKKLVQHGEWSKWLEEHIGFTQRTAQNYMKLARTFADWKGPDILYGKQEARRDRHRICAESVDYQRG